MKLRILGIFFGVFLLVSCQNDISLLLEPKNTYYGNDFYTIEKSEIQNYLFQNVYLELFWRDGFPIRFFDYSHRNTALILQQYGEVSANIEIVSAEIIIKDLNIAQLFYINSNMVVSKNGDRYIINLRDCLSDILNTQNDLLKFKDVNEVSVKISLKSGQNEKNMIFNFVPVIQKSNRLLNNIMSI